MKQILQLFTLCLISAVTLGQLNGQPTDNPVASKYGDTGYPAWTNQIAWDNVLDVTTDARLSGAVAVANDPSAGAANFAAFEAARDILYSSGGGVLYFPAGTYHFSLPDMGYGPGIGPLSRGLMLKEGIVIRGEDPSGTDAIIRNSSQKLDVTYDLAPTTTFVFPFEKRGTVPASATGVDGEPAGTANAAGETPTDWSFIGMTAGANEAKVSDVDNVGIVNVELVGGTIVFGFDSVWATHMGASGAKWEAANYKVDWPEGSAANSEDWINRVPNGEHYGDLINGRVTWNQEVFSGSGRLVMNVKMVDGAPWNDMMYADRKASDKTVMPKDAFSHYRFAGRIIAYGSNVFVANNVLAKPTRNFVHTQKQDVGDKAILFDYANHLGIDINKSLYGGNQDHPSVHTIDGEGYYASNVVIRDNFIFNRGNKGVEVSGHHVVVENNHNQRYVAANNFPYEYITNPEAYPSAVEGGDINAGGISFDGYRWQVTESASDYLSRGFDLGGMDVWVDNCTVINTGSRGNDGEGILGQRHNNVETLSWSITNSKFGPFTIDNTPSSSNGANNGYIGPYDMHSVGLFLMGNEGPGNVGILKPENNFILDSTWFNNSATQATPASGHSDDWIAPGKSTVPHSDAVAAPALTGVLNSEGTGVELTWVDNAANELGFRVDRSVNGGDWQTIVYRPRASESLSYPDLAIGSAKGEFDVGDIVQTQWTDFLAPTGKSLEYRVVAINQLDDASTGVSNTVSLQLAAVFSGVTASFDGLTVGALNAQGDWTAPAQATVQSGGLDYTASDNGTISGGSQSLYLDGDAAAKMNDYAILDLGAAPTESYYVGMLLSTDELGVDSAKSEIFVQLHPSNWKAYTALKFFDDRVELPAQTTGDNFLDSAGLTTGDTHLVVIGVDADGSGNVTGMDLYINPVRGDVGSPALSVDLSDKGMTLAELTVIRLRSQNTASSIDEVKVSYNWDDIVPDAAPFAAVSASFDSLTVGALNGQGAWTAPAQASVQTGGIDYEGSDFGTVSGGTQSLYLDGDAAAKMNDYAIWDLGSAPVDSYYVGMLVATAELGVDSAKSEVFVQLHPSNWKAYTALKFFDDRVELPAQTTGDNFLDSAGLTANETHLVVIGVNADGSGNVTGMDLYINPVRGDAGSPAFSVDLSDKGLTLAELTVVRLRSQNTATTIDEVQVTYDWEDVVPEAAPFAAVSESFDSLTIGTLEGQGAWTAPAQASVQASGLEYTASDNGTISGGSQSLYLDGDANAKMNDYAIWNMGIAPESSYYVGMLLSTAELGVDTDRSEIFVQMHPSNWKAYAALKFFDNRVELPAPTTGDNFLESVGLTANETHLVVIGVNADASGNVTGMDLYINPVRGDAGSPALSVDLSDKGMTLAELTVVRLRSQNTATTIDEVKVTYNWDDIVPEAMPFEAVSTGFEDLVTGALGGQGAWVAPAQASVQAGGLSYLGSDMGEISGGAQSLLLDGDAAAKMNDYAVWNLAIAPEASYYVGMLMQTDELGTTSDKSEVFVQVHPSNWKAYAAFKFFDDQIELPAPTTGTNALDSAGLTAGDTHLVVIAVNADANGNVTSMDAYLNPVRGDQGSPDLSVDLSDKGMTLSELNVIRLRSQNTATSIDELKVSYLWEDVVPAEASNPFKLVALDFEGPGNAYLDGNGAWSLASGVSVTDTSISYTSPDTRVYTGGEKALTLNGSTATPINAWSAYTISTEAPDETFFVSYIAGLSDNGTDDPEELFVRNASWSLFSALKVGDDIFELNGEQATGLGLAFDTMYHVVVKATVSDGVVTQLDGWVNPVVDADLGTNGRQEPAPNVTVSGLTLDVSSVTGFELRSQKAAAVVDQLIMTESWPEAFEIRRLKFDAVSSIGSNIQAEGIEDLVSGPGLSPHDPADEQVTQDSIPLVEFQSMLTAAYDSGIGGVADFETTNATITSGLEGNSGAAMPWTMSLTIGLGSKDVHVGLGPNAYAHGSCSNGYFGKQCSESNFLITSPPVSEDDYRLYEWSENANTSSGTGRIGGMNSFDLTFDPGDRLVAVGLVQVSYDNFQSYQQGGDFDTKPNIRVHATFTNGVEERVLISTQLSEQTANRNIFFGFESPESGFYLSRVELWQVGNNARAWISFDDLAVIAERTDEFTFTFNNEGTVNGTDRTIQDADWDGYYTSAATPLVTDANVFADLSEGVSDDTTPGHYKAGFLFVSGKNGAPAPEGFFVFSENTEVADTQQSNPNGINPQQKWYSDPVNSVSNLNELMVESLRSITLRIKPRNPDQYETRFHPAVKLNGTWYVSEDFVVHSDAVETKNNWETYTVDLMATMWYSDAVSDSAINFDFTAVVPTKVSLGDLDPDTTLESVGIYIDTDDRTGEQETWARVDSIVLEATVPALLPPAISSQPTSVDTIPGETVEFSVTVLDTDVTYQWYRGDDMVAGGTSATLVLDNVSSTESGSYTVQVTGPGGTSTSDAAVLTVHPLPTVNPDALNLDSTAGLQFVTVTANAAANWTSSSPVDWVTIDDGATGTGDGLVTLFLTGNSGPLARRTTLSLAGNDVPVAQTGDLTSLFSDTTKDTDSDWWMSDTFGYYQATENATDSMLYSEDHLWMTVVAETAESGKFWAFDHNLENWIHIDEEVYPWIYSADLGEWLYFELVDGDRQFWVGSLEEWKTETELGGL